MAVLGCGGAVLSYRLENDRLFYSCVFIRGGLFLATALYEIKGVWSWEAASFLPLLSSW